MNHVSQYEANQMLVSNYAVAFLDLLGQREAMAGEGELPELKTPEDHAAFLSRVRASVGSIRVLYAHAELMLREMHRRKDSPLQATLSDAQQEVWNQVHTPTVRTQRWSDGLMAFSSLAEPVAPCPTVAIFELLVLAGSLCLIGLASRRPIRGGLDIAWGVELREGELHGPAVACAYEVESTVAKYPRMAISPRMNKYLHYAGAVREEGTLESLRVVFAERCLGMLTTDLDGVVIIDYLGAAFRDAVGSSSYEDLLRKARAFAVEQKEHHASHANEKLSRRYDMLLRYFGARST